jgi:integrase
VQIFVNAKVERRAPSVRYHIRATLSRKFATAKQWDYVDSNPVLGVRRPHKKVVRPKITLKPSQIQQILEWLDEPHRTIVLVDAITGMRASELLALKWSDVHFERGLLSIRQSYYRGNFGPPKNRSNERTIPRHKLRWLSTCSRSRNPSVRQSVGWNSKCSQIWAAFQVNSLKRLAGRPGLEPG